MALRSNSTVNTVSIYSVLLWRAGTRTPECPYTAEALVDST